MTTTFKTIAIALVSFGLLSACSSNSETSDPSTAISSKYIGTYAAPCSAAPDDDGIYQTDSLAFSGLSAVLTAVEYSDDQCTTPIVTFEFNLQLTFPGGTQTTPLGEADYFDTYTASATMNGAVVDEADLVESIRRQYTIILLNESNLYFGGSDNEDDGYTAATRLLVLDTEDYYVLQ